ncbi:hypothetical protein ZIOFF_070571 [Zingiber officinale]|uniref:GH16 domain-containing protein n=1 Tax=Zingiber officinale TaxID=94328 RepID=A0A8J5CU51_ZINOF|nr:hypothetical protein ZIOFF_070571 [Zingiber officinale]
MLPSHEAAFLQELPNIATISFEEGNTQLFGDSNLMLHSDDRTIDLSLDQRIGAAFASQDLYLHGFFSASIKLPSDYMAGVVVAFYVTLLISSRPPSRASPKIPPSSHLRRFFSALHLPRPPLWDDLKPLVRPLSFGNFTWKEKKVNFHDKVVHSSLFGVGAPEALVIGVIDLRILKAVALEHPNDIDAAAESILVEILPSIATSHESSFALQDANEVVHVSTSDGKGKHPMFYEHQEEERTSNHLSGNELVVWENRVSSHGPTSASANTGSSYSKRYLLVLIE